MARGRIISQRVHEGVMDWVHGGGHRIRRVIVNGLALTYTQKTVYVFPWDVDPQDDSVKEIGDVEVPDDVVTAARQYLTAKEHIAKALDGLDCSDRAAEDRRQAAVAEWEFR